MAKRRLDCLLMERGLFPTRTRAAAAVMAGEVRVGRGERRAAKPGELVDVGERLLVPDRPAFVSRGGIKLANALQASGLEVRGRSALDVGASTGGFTDCLLQGGARDVTTVDVGYGTLAHRLRADPRVCVIERCNARTLTAPKLLAARRACAQARGAQAVGAQAVPAGAEAGPAAGQTVPAGAHAVPADAEAGPGDAELPDLATIDVSFISLAKVLEPILSCLAAGYDVLALIKPQFEVGRGQVGKGGVVRDPERRRAALVSVGERALALGAAVRGYHPSGLPGPKGNRETFIWLGDPASTGGGTSGVGVAEEKVLERMAGEADS